MDGTSGGLGPSPGAFRGGNFLALYGPLGVAKKNRNLGRSQILGREVIPGATYRAAGGVLPVTAQPVVTLIKAGASDPPGDQASALSQGDALAAAIAFTCWIKPTIPGQPIPSVRGFVKWGTDGTQQEASFDWLNGTVLSIVCSSLEVSAIYLGGAGEQNVNVGAFCGYFTTACCAAQLTDLVADLTAGPFAFPVPPMARALEVQWADVIGGGIPAVTFFADNPPTPANLISGPMETGVGNGSAQIAIPARALSVEIDKGGGGGPHPGALIWQLAM